jgi:hypothetical protein
MASKPMIWDYDNPPFFPLAEKISTLAHDLYSKQIPGAKMGINRFFSLYAFLLQNLHVPPAELQTRIISQGAPIFDLRTLQSIMSTISTQQNTDFARRILQSKMSGGGAGSGGIHKNLSSGPPSTSEFDKDPSRSKFWDVFIRRILFGITKNIPLNFDRFVPIVFMLYSLEQIEVLGPLIATFLDSITLGLPILGELLSTGMKTIVMLAPIPYAGFVGDLLAYFVSLIFIMISSTMSVSRKQFGTSFVVGLGAVPFIGEQVSDAALLFEKSVERYEFNKKKFLTSIGALSPHTAAVVDSWAPAKESRSGPYLLFDSDLALVDLFKKVVDTYGEDAAMASITDPSSLPIEAKNIVSDKYKDLIGPKKIGGRRRTRKIRK